MLEAEFDRFAAEYRAQHAANIRLSGETPDFFARYKIDDVADALGRLGTKPRRILDFGAGVGNSLPFMRGAFRDGEIVLLDPSARSLDIAQARFPGAARFRHFDGRTIPYENAHFDLVFAACVFHHIPAERHIDFLQEIDRVLAPRGSFFLFEHNPLNPLTLRTVRSCAFDENAALIRAGTMRKRFVAAGFSEPKVAYRLFFPHWLAALRPLERYLVNVPFGAQYFVHAVKPAV